MKNLMFIKQFGLLLTIVCIVLCYGCPSSPTLPIDYEYTYFHPDNYVWVQAADINENGEIVGSHIIYCKYGLCQDYSTGFIYSGGNFAYILPEGWRSSYANTINDTGDVIGWGEDGEGAEKCFIYSSGQYTELLPPGWVNACARDINNKRDVVGGGADSEGVGKGFIYSEGQYIELLPPGWINAGAHDINDNGGVLGDGYDGNGVHKGFIYSNGKYTELLPPDWINARFYYINNNDEVIGEVDYGTGLPKAKKGFIYSGGKYTFFLPPGMNDIRVAGINDSGEVIGSAQDPDSFTLYGFVYRNGRFTYLPAWVIPCGINNKGVVVGHAGYYRDGVQGFIATPITTPK